jgi:hypothetical protein
MLLRVNKTLNIESISLLILSQHFEGLGVVQNRAEGTARCSDIAVVVWHLEGISRAREKRKSDRVKQVEEESTRLVGGQMRGRRVEVSFSQERKGKEKKDFGIFKFWWRYERVPRQDNASPERPYRVALYVWPKTKAQNKTLIHEKQGISSGMTASTLSFRCTKPYLDFRKQLKVNKTPTISWLSSPTESPSKSHRTSNYLLPGKLQRSSILLGLLLFIFSRQPSLSRVTVLWTPRQIAFPQNPRRRNTHQLVGQRDFQLGCREQLQSTICAQCHR